MQPLGHFPITFVLILTFWPPIRIAMSFGVLAPRLRRTPPCAQATAPHTRQKIKKVMTTMGHDYGEPDTGPAAVRTES